MLKCICLVWVLFLSEEVQYNEMKDNVVGINYMLFLLWDTQPLYAFGEQMKLAVVVWWVWSSG